MLNLLGTKAETLEKLSGILTSGKVLPQVRFTAQDWRTDRDSALARVFRADWAQGEVIVRSSGIAEDQAQKSMAGKFLSVAGVHGADGVFEAVERVLLSMEKSAPHPMNQVFVQPLIQNVSISGVVFSRDPNTGSDYRVVSFDDCSGTTSSVTSGKTNNVKTFFCHRFAPASLHGRFENLMTLVDELERILGCADLDIEFAQDSAGILYLFQVRPLSCICPLVQDSTSLVSTLKSIQSKLSQLAGSRPFLFGDKAVFGIMPDWNPAEMIGVRPRPLSLSLYREMITDSIWAYQRDNYGYRNLRSFPLLLSFAGLPYIDVRVDFNSFIPKDIPNDLAERLVRHYIDQLVAKPGLHDKVEFEIVYSCYTFDLPQRLNALRGAGFGDDDCHRLEQSLRHLTNKIINGATGLWKRDREKIDLLDSRRREILESSADKVTQIYWLLEDCKRYGTLPFAGLARAAFIAIQLLKSMIQVGILSVAEYEAYVGSLDLVSTKMGRDFKTMSQGDFLAKYGHLRPGTYDILSPRYDEDPERYFNWDQTQEASTHQAQQRFALSLSQLNQIAQFLKNHLLEHDVLGLFGFLEGAIEGREYSKFVFTRHLSDALSLLKQVGAEEGISNEDLSYARIDCIRQAYGSSDEIGSLLRKSILAGKQEFALTKQLVLPPLITDPNDVWSFTQPQFSPNFITQKSVTGNVVTVESPLNHLKDSIMLISSADPGFDWVFSHGIAGFVTAYGGANSHMAIRAGELGIPAVIGAGEIAFEQWKLAKTLMIDGMNRQVVVLR